MAVEQLGIVAELQARRQQYARFAYVAPTFVEPVPVIERPKPRPRPKPRKYPPTRAFRRAVKAVCNAWDVTEYEVLSPYRTVRLCHPRFALYRICRRRLGWSFPYIAHAMGGFHHTSVIYGNERAIELHRHHLDWRERYEAALKELSGGVA